MKYHLFLLHLIIPIFLFAQTPEQVNKITERYDQTKLQNLQEKFYDQSAKDKAFALKYAKQKDIKPQITYSDGNYAELQTVMPDGTLLYYKTNNADAAESTRTNHLNIGGSTGFDLDGQNMTAYVWDGGHALESHQEFDGPGGNNRISVEDASEEGGLQLTSHANHVIGTISASGVESDAKGMAPRSQVKNYKWNYDIAEATTAASNGMLVSNHSYGLVASTLSDNLFGAYSNYSRSWDVLHFNAPYYLMVVSAGNYGSVNENESPLNSNYPNLDKLSYFTTSKNNMVVANAQDANVNSNGDLISVSINSASSQGPTDDYRIKPDITGNGTALYSTTESSDTSYGYKTGTSMASPNVAGSLLLLQEHYNNINNTFMRSATLKGLALHTADDIGMTGPDAIHGWGLLNAKRAAETISKNGNTSLIQELTLAQGQTFTTTVDANGANDLTASISWTDPAGSATVDLNNTTPRLINDLDIKITKNADEWYPWRLTDVNANANDSDNFRDPFERIEVSNPTGTYTITITHKGYLTGGFQNYSLIVTGITNPPEFCNAPQNLAVTNIQSTSADLSWNASPEAVNGYDWVIMEFGDEPDVNNSVDSANAVSSTSDSALGLSAGKDYSAYVRTDCGSGNKSDWSTAVNFSSTPPANDDACNAIPLSIDSNSAGDAYKNIGATKQTDEPDTNLSGGVDGSVWFTFVAPTYGNVQVTTNIPGGTLNDTEIAVYSLSDCANFSTYTQIDFNQNVDINSGNLLSTLNLYSLNAGETYYVQVDRWSTARDGTFGIEVKDLITYVYDGTDWLPQNPAGNSTNINNLIIETGTAPINAATTANEVIIEADAILDLNANLNADATFKSDNSGTAQLEDVEGNSINGEIEVQRFIPAGTNNLRAFRFLSTAVNSNGTIWKDWQQYKLNPGDTGYEAGYGTHITGTSDYNETDGFDVTGSGNPSLLVFNNQTQTWSPIANTYPTQLKAGNAYNLFVRGDRSIDLTLSSASQTPTNTTLRSTGTLATGSLTTGTELPALADQADEWSLIGNPYQAIVDFGALNFTGDIKSTILYIWNPNAGTQGSYESIDNAADQMIQPGQSFFVQNSGNVNTPPTITFTESDKNTSGNVTSVFNTNDVAVANLELYNNNTKLDVIKFRFKAGADNGLDDFDAGKLGNPTENLASLNGNTLLSIERRDIPAATVTVPLFINQYQSTDYKFQLNTSNWDDSIDVYLQDDHLDEVTLLEADGTISFTVDANIPESIATNRFSLIFENTTFSIDDNELADQISLYPNPSEGQFTIQTKGLNNNVDVRIYNMTGKQVSQKSYSKISDKKLNVNAGNLAAGVYIVEMTANKESYSAQLIIK